MRAAFEMFKAFNTQDAADNRKLAAEKLPMPVLTIEGHKAMGGALATKQNSLPIMLPQSLSPTPDIG
jgi:hypothetical protein